MKDNDLNLAFETVTKKEVATLLTRNAALKYFTPFMQSEHSLSSAAKALGIQKTAMYYHLKKFLSMGILRCVRQEKRAGRASKIYKASSERYFIPFQLTGAETVEKLALASDYDLLKVFTHSWIKTSSRYYAQWGIWVFKNVAGQIGTAISKEEPNIQNFFERDLDPESPAIVAAWMLPSLSFENAKRLQKDLIELYQRYYRESEVTSEQQYLIHFGLTPFDPH